MYIYYNAYELFSLFRSVPRPRKLPAIPAADEAVAKQGSYTRLH